MKVRPIGFRLTDPPASWDQVKLQDVLKEVDERADEVGNGSEIPVLSLTKDRGLIPQSQRFAHRIARRDVDAYKVIRQGRIAYNPMVLWEGAVHALYGTDAGLISPVYVTWEVQPNADWRYLDFLLRTSPMLQEYLRLCSGVVKRRRLVNKRAFKDILIALPPIEEQRRISDVLLAARTALEAASAVVDAAFELRKSITHHLLAYGPIPVGCLPETAESPELGAIPTHWRARPLEELIKKAQYGLSLRGSDDGRYPILRMNNIVDGKITESPLQFVDIDDQGIAERFLVHRYDLLFNRTNSLDRVGKTGLFDLEGDFVFASYLIRLQVDADSADPYYINFYLNSPPGQRRLKARASRAISQANINATKLKALTIPCPPLPDQAAIAEIMRGIDKKIEAEQLRMESLRVLLRALTDNLIYGKVRVPEAAKQELR
jgi:type I restriction enzyme S subunit